MVRLVFRPYAQVRRTICTSVSLQASTIVSDGFTLPKYSSPSFGSQQRRSSSSGHSKLQPAGRQCTSKRFLPQQSYDCLPFRCAYKGLPPKHSRRRQTPWSVFQDGSDRSIWSAPQHKVSTSVQATWQATRARHDDTAYADCRLQHEWV
jgi:hypothetical protein